VAGIFESGIFALNLGLAPLFDGSHWYDEDPSMLEQNVRFFGSRLRLNQLIEREELVREVRALSGRWLAKALGPNDRYLVEKTPQHLATMQIIAELFPGATFVHVLRDGRDVVVSRHAAARTWPGRQPPPPAVGATAVEWADAVRRARRESKDLRYLEVRYEELRKAPADCLRRVFDFSRIPADRLLIEQICEETSLAKQRRHEGDAFRRRGQVGEWRSRFGLRDRLRFQRGAGDMLIELGYERSRAWWLAPRWGFNPRQGAEISRS
jgi:hypothetical protein